MNYYSIIRVRGGIHVLLLVGRVEMVRNMAKRRVDVSGNITLQISMDIPLKLVDQQGRPLSSPALVPNRVLDLHFVKNGAVVQLHEEGIAD